MPGLPLWRRGSKYLKQKFFSVAVIAFVLGLLITMQLRVVSQPPAEIIPGARAHELAAELRRLEEASASLGQEARDLEDKLLAATQGYAQAEAALKTEIEKNKTQAGLVPMVGPGVEVRIHNRPTERLPGMNEHLFAVRDEDILRVVNELWGAGAEAMAINGQRLVSTSEIRLAGTFINVNLNRVTPPYVIVAIGDPDVLQATLEMEGGVAETLRKYGVNFVVEKKDEVEVPAYGGTMAFRYAKPIKEGAKD